MTFREKLADLISGGEITRLRDEAALVWWPDREYWAWKQLETFRRIAAMETPGANATVRRMAKTAREALE